jgi:hypothetical protein
LVPQDGLDRAFLDSLVKRAAETTLQQKPVTLPISDINMGLRRWYIDAIASAIEDGTACFHADAKWTPGKTRAGGKIYISDDQDPFNAASRFARQVRLALDEPSMSEQYLGRERKLLSLSLSFSYYREEPSHISMPWLTDLNICEAGTSVYGENVRKTWGNFQIGNPNPSLPAGDYTKVWAEVFYILAFGMAVVYGQRWRYFLIRRLRLASLHKDPRNRVRSADTELFQNLP